MTSPNSAEGPVSTEAGPSRVCTKCQANPVDPKHHSWCRPCLRAAAAAYRDRTRPRERLEDRPCERAGCDRTFTWRSTHPKQRYCSKDCYTQGVLDERQARRDQAKLDAAMVGKQRCSHCGEVKPDDQFRKARQCRACAAEITSAWRARHPDRAAEIARTSAQRRRLKKYGLTPERYAQMLVDQAGLCAICDAQLRPDHIDHDHQLGGVRGLLCGSCNTRLHDGPVEWYGLAADYLRGARPSA